MVPKIQWKLRNLFAITTVVAIYLGSMKYLKLPFEESVVLASTLILAITILYERKMPQWVSLAIAAICLYFILRPSVQ